MAHPQTSDTLRSAPDQPRKIGLVAWAAERGLTTDADVQGHIHAGLRSMPTTKTYRRWYDQKLTELQAARDATVAAYRAEVEARRVVEATVQERLEQTAAGHPDNAAVQAAQRVLAKKAATRGVVALMLSTSLATGV